MAPIITYNIPLDISYKSFSEIQEWCKNYIGLGGHNKYNRYYNTWIDDSVWSITVTMFNTSHIDFREEKYYNWFILKWGNCNE